MIFILDASLARVLGMQPSTVFFYLHNRQSSQHVLTVLFVSMVIPRNDTKQSLKPRYDIALLGLTFSLLLSSGTVFRQFVFLSQIFQLKPKLILLHLRPLFHLLYCAKENLRNTPRSKQYYTDLYCNEFKR